jgi:hypothetical protein
MDKQSSGSEGASKEPETGLHHDHRMSRSLSGPTQTSVNWHAETAMDDPDTLEVRIHHILLGDPDRVEVTVAD